MQYRLLGSTGIEISALAFGAGPVPAVMTGTSQDQATELIQHAIASGINWFDTAATYGQGQSEKSLGSALRHLAASEKVHLATKVRLMPEDLDDIAHHVRASLKSSLRRLGVSRVTLLQLHNSLTAQRGEEPTSLTPSDVLSPGGVLQAMKQLQSEGLVKHLGLTAIGQKEALKEVVESGQFATIQVPYHLLNPSAGQTMADDFTETDYGNIMATCATQQMGVFAIRVMAGGALAGASPSTHTHTTKFFPLDLYHRDSAVASQLEKTLPGHLGLKEAAIRFALSHPQVNSAIIGFSQPEHIDQAVNSLQAGVLPQELIEEINKIV